MNEQELLVNIRDKHDYSYVYGELYQITRGLAKKKGLTDDDAFDDVYQNTVMVLFLTINKVDFELTSKLSVFFIGIFVRQMYKHFNKVSISVPEHYDIGYEVDFDSNVSVISEIISTSIEGLSKNQRFIIEFMYFDEKSQKEIANELGFSSTDSIKTQKYKAIKKLKGVISAKLIEYGIDNYQEEF